LHTELNSQKSFEMDSFLPQHKALVPKQIGESSVRTPCNRTTVPNRQSPVGFFFRAIHFQTHVIEGDETKMFLFSNFIFVGIQGQDSPPPVDHGETGRRFVRGCPVMMGASRPAIVSATARSTLWKLQAYL